MNRKTQTQLIAIVFGLCSGLFHGLFVTFLLFISELLIGAMIQMNNFSYPFSIWVGMLAGLPALLWSAITIFFQNRH